MYPLVSVALCTYNGERYLIEQLDSLVQQDYPNIEIIAVDDCSTDDTLNILKDYAARYHNFKVYQNELNLGYKKNFEKAIQLCKGEYIALSDQDDIWMIDKISILMNSIHDEKFIYHDSAFINSNGNSLNKKMSDILNMYSGDSYHAFLFFNCVSGHACLFSRDIIVKCLPFPDHIMHDQWLAFCAANIQSIIYIPRPLVLYRQHESSDTDILKLGKSKSELTSKEKIIKSVQMLETFSDYRFAKNPDFILKLKELYHNRIHNAINFKLIIFMFKHYQTLLYIYKKSKLSKFNFIYKHIWGLKLKSNKL